MLIGSVNAQAGKKLAVFVSIAPQKYFVHQIGRERVDVQVMVQPGASPATYEPKPRQMAALSKTPIYFAIGVPFEKNWLKKITAANPKHAGGAHGSWYPKNPHERTSSGC